MTDKDPTLRDRFIEAGIIASDTDDALAVVRAWLHSKAARTAASEGFRRGMLSDEGHISDAILDALARLVEQDI